MNDTMVIERPYMPAGVDFDGKGFFRMAPIGKQELGIEEETGRPYADVRYEKRYCKFPEPFMDENQVEILKRECNGARIDFLDPVFGWLRNGVKPEKEHPENYGHLFEEPPTDRVYLDDAPAVGPASAPPKGGTK